MIKEKNKVDQVVESYLKLKSSTLIKFCEKQNLDVFVVLSYSEQEVICFSPELKMSFKDIFLDLQLHIESGIAVRYMQGFDLDLDDAQITKELNYKEYLESKKLI
nr:hypothetical protein [uncultured Flavobacterium sp.]